MNLTDSILEDVQDEIHFEKLLKEAIAEIRTYSGKVWNDFGEHDPGITQLQAILYYIADLAYRNTLPLPDLLTPPKEDQRQGIFPTSFSGRNVLSHNPVSVNDYRKLLLDIVDKSTKTNFRSVRNVLLKAPIESHGISYSQDLSLYKYKLNDNSNKEEYRQITPPGQCEVGFIQNNVGDQTAYIGFFPHDNPNPIPEIYNRLSFHQNYGESFVFLSQYETQYVETKVSLELEDDCIDYARVIAELFIKFDEFLNSCIYTQTVEDLFKTGLSSQEIFNSPKLLHGQITQLPKELYNQSVTVNYSCMYEVLKQINGVKSVIFVGNEDSTTWNLNPNKYYQFYKYPSEELSNPDNVSLYKSGGPVYVVPQYDTSTDENKRKYIQQVSNEIYSRLKWDDYQFHSTAYPYGQFRNTGSFIPLVPRLPEIYEVQKLNLTDSALQLYQFLIVFEQLLKNQFEQLSMLPKLLNFIRQHGDIVTDGGSWPFENGSLSDQIHAEYKQALIDFTQDLQKNADKEWMLIHYLLDYFSASPLDMLSNVFDFTIANPDQKIRAINIQKDYLANIADVMSDCMRINRLGYSGIERKISAILNLQLPTISQETPPELVVIDNNDLFPISNDGHLIHEGFSRHFLHPYDACVFDEYKTNWGGLSTTYSDVVVIYIYPDTFAALVNEQENDFTIRIRYTGKGAGIFNGMYNGDHNNTYVELTIKQKLWLQTDELVYKAAIIVEKTALEAVFNENGNIQEFIHQTNLGHIEIDSYNQSEGYDCRFNYEIKDQNQQENSCVLHINPFPAYIRAGDKLQFLNDSDNSEVDGVFTIKSINALEGQVELDYSAGDGFDITIPTKYKVFLHETSRVDKFGLTVSVILNKSILYSQSNQNLENKTICHLVKSLFPGHLTINIYFMPDQDFKAFYANYYNYRYNSQIKAYKSMIENLAIMQFHSPV